MSPTRAISIYSAADAAHNNDQGVPRHDFIITQKVYRPRTFRRENNRELFAPAPKNDSLAYSQPPVIFKLIRRTFEIQMECFERFSNFDSCSSESLIHSQLPLPWTGKKWTRPLSNQSSNHDNGLIHSARRGMRCLGISRAHR